MSKRTVQSYLHDLGYNLRRPAHKKIDAKNDAKKFRMEKYRNLSEDVWK